LKYWYHETTGYLHNILWEIKEVDGHIFDHQGQLNRDYRQQLVEIILRALNGLAALGNLRTSPGYAKIARPPDPSLP
jgi:hypothetical protein